MQQLSKMLGKIWCGKMKQRILNYLEENDKVAILEDIARDVNSYNASLDWLDVIENDKYGLEILFGDNLEELARAICYGEYNYRDAYIRLNGYGNLQSLDDNDLEKELLDNEEDIIREFIELVEAGSLNLTDYIGEEN